MAVIIGVTYTGGQSMSENSRLKWTLVAFLITMVVLSVLVGVSKDVEYKGTRVDLIGGNCECVTVDPCLEVVCRYKVKGRR